MSRIGKLPVIIPNGVTISQKNNQILVKGPKGELKFIKPELVNVSIDDKQLTVEATQTNKKSKAMHGLTRSIINNMTVGVTDGWSKKLVLQGVGYRAKMEGNDLNLSLGFSHPVIFNPPEGIQISVKDQTQITIEGADKQVVGEVAASIRRYYPVEPYKGKGIHYEGERIRRKQGKKVS